MGDYDRNRGGGNFAAAFMGMIIGAVGAATAIFVSRKENRDMLKDRVDELRIKGQRAAGELKKGVEKARKERR